MNLRSISKNSFYDPRIKGLFFIFFVLTLIFFSSYFLTRDVKAATTLFTVNWSAGFEGFSYTQTSACGGLVPTCSSGRVNDTVISTNVLFVSGTSVALTGNNTGYWSRTLTWQTMGVPLNAEVKSVVGSIDGRRVTTPGGSNYVGVQIFDSANTTNAVVSDAAVVTNSEVTTSWVTYSGSSQNIKTAYEDATTSVTIRINKRAEYGLLLGSAETRAHNLSITITYELPVLDQNNWRFFANSNSTDVGAPLAAQNTIPTLGQLNSDFRLRMTAVDTLADLPVNYEAYKLQYVDRGSGTCVSPTGGTPATYTDVNGSTLIAYNDNASVADGATLTTNANDPTITGGSVIAQTYEEANNFSNSVAQVVKLNAAMWDFSLKTNGADPGKSFCFRIVKSTGVLLNSYTSYPQINTVSPFISVDFVDSGGSVVSSPSMSFTAKSQSSYCISSNATLGVANQKIRVSNITTTPGWNLSIAASGGNTSQWSDGLNSTDFNDGAGTCGDGPDSDGNGGQMSINGGSTTVTPLAGCNATGISTGGGNFEEGVSDSITIATASNAADNVCEFDIENYLFTQTLPAGLPQGSYILQFTLTVVSN